MIRVVEITFQQALLHSHIANELWRDYLQHKTKENLDKYHKIVGIINSGQLIELMSGDGN